MRKVLKIGRQVLSGWVVAGFACFAMTTLVAADSIAKTSQANAGMQEPEESLVAAIDHASGSHASMVVVLVCLTIALGCIAWWVYGNNFLKWCSALWNSSNNQREVGVGGNR